MNSTLSALSLSLFLPFLGAGCGGASPEVASRPLPPDFREVVQSAKTKVFPAVVFIKCLQESMEEGKKITHKISGSGVIISPAGEVLTNWHVIDKAAEVRCLLSDGQALEGTVLGSDKDTDLALVRLNRPAGAPPLPCASFGNAAALKEGDFVMAMGAPWGLSRSVSIGIISCTRRFLSECSEYSLWLQTDASICPGNSGGPLVNTAGEVIGINSRGTMQGGDMGFAVPSETLRFIVSEIRAHGKVAWSWSGLQLQPLRDFERNMMFEGSEGVIVSGTDPESPARRAGLQPKDRILSLNGTALTAFTEEDLPAMRRALGLLPIGISAVLQVVRDGKPLTLQMTPREKGKVEGEELDCPRWDLTVKTINQFDNEDLFFYRTEGVFIYGLKSPGNASGSGLSPKDILLSVDGKEVKTLQDVREIHKVSLAQVTAKPRLVLSVLRNGLMRQIVLDVTRDYAKE